MRAVDHTTPAAQTAAADHASAGLRDVEVHLPARPGALAALGEALGTAGVSIAGGGVFTHAGVGVAHFLVAEGERARDALERAGLGPVTVRAVVLLRLDQETPGQLGTAARLLADADVDVLVQYSDHAGSLVLVVDEARAGAAAEVAAGWAARSRTGDGP